MNTVVSHVQLIFTKVKTKAFDVPCQISCDLVNSVSVLQQSNFGKLTLAQRLNYVICRCVFKMKLFRCVGHVVLGIGRPVRKFGSMVSSSIPSLAMSQTLSGVFADVPMGMVCENGI